ncbi:MAG: phosphoglucosamine mutase [Thermodesulfobacteriota bacterium]
MKTLFGTDGVRGVANEYPMTPEMALRLGKAVAFLMAPQRSAGQGGADILIGKDTRESGGMLESALAAGIASMGCNAWLTGVLPTPGIAHLVKKRGARAGIVVSASHNPYHDNGIKLFDHEGYKLSRAWEEEIESLVLTDAHTALAHGIRSIGSIRPMPDAAGEYIDFILNTSEHKQAGGRLKIVMDCANGAASPVAPVIFQQWGAEVSKVLSVEPDGRNINENCGSEHPQALIRSVRETGADIGLAFDGDADRLVAVDETGAPVSGDQILAVCAQAMQQRGRMTSDLVVSTVMSNLGFTAALEKMGLRHFAAQVGDRFVMEAMRQHGSVLGGEDSGHLIFLQHHTTGDGILAAIQLMEAMVLTGKPLSVLKQVMDIFPQELVNVTVKHKPPLESIPEIAAAISAAEKELKGRGRVLVRYSGTQSICRVMVEGPTPSQTSACCRRIADVIRQHIG